MKRTIKQLAETKGRVYGYAADKETGIKFMKAAEEEGFTFGDGAKPTEREWRDFIAVNHDCTINYIGTYGRVAFGATDKVGDEKLIKIDLKKYLDGEEDYILNK